MSKIEQIKEEMEIVISNLQRIPDEFFVPRSRDGADSNPVVWVIERDDGTAGSYETSEERLGITKKGEVIWGYSSGCSCWDGWESGDYEPEVSWKEFKLKKIKTHDLKPDTWIDRTSEKGEYDLGFIEGWEEDALQRLKDLTILVKKEASADDVFRVHNQEIRRYLIKRMGYENLKAKIKDLEIVHVDGTSELIKVKYYDPEGRSVEEMYVKVQDSSTDREYLLNVPNTLVIRLNGVWSEISTCRRAIAWTFDLDEKDYNPVQET